LNLLEWQLLTGLDLHSFVATPDALFADPTNFDYHLAANSPAIGAATSQNAPSDDIEWNPRPSDGVWDIGAYQHVSSSNSFPGSSYDWLRPPRSQSPVEIGVLDSAFLDSHLAGARSTDLTPVADGVFVGGI
jgi:hypothetical protein